MREILREREGGRADGIWGHLFLVIIYLNFYFSKIAITGFYAYSWHERTYCDCDFEGSSLWFRHFSFSENCKIFCLQDSMQIREKRLKRITCIKR